MDEWMSEHISVQHTGVYSATMHAPLACPHAIYNKIYDYNIINLLIKFCSCVYTILMRT